MFEHFEMTRNIFLILEHSEMFPTFQNGTELFKLFLEHLQIF